jgi:hypothetical protein
MAACIAGAAFAGSSAVPAARADSLDPTLPQRIMIGPPRGPAPMARLNAQRTGRSSMLLPQRPRLAWRARAPASIEGAPVIDGKGRIVLTTATALLVQLDATGRLEWTARIGSALPATSPVLTNDGARAVITTAGELVKVDARGRLLMRRSLPFSEALTIVASLPLDDGTLVVAARRELLQLESDGSLRARTTLGDDVRTLLQQTDVLITVSERGIVHSWKPPDAPLELGRFAGRVDEGAVLTGPDRLSAVVDHRKMVELELKTGVRRLRSGGETLTLYGPPAALANGETRVMSFDGLLLGHDRSGRETLRVALDPQRAPGTTLLSEGASPPVVVDASGTVGFARPGLDAGIVTARGEVVTAPGATCIDPIVIIPAGPRKMVVACRSGVLIALNDAKP